MRVITGSMSTSLPTAFPVIAPGGSVAAVFANQAAAIEFASLFEGYAAGAALNAYAVGVPIVPNSDGLYRKFQNYPGAPYVYAVTQSVTATCRFDLPPLETNVFVFKPANAADIAIFYALQMRTAWVNHCQLTGEQLTGNLAPNA